MRKYKGIRYANIVGLCKWHLLLYLGHSFKGVSYSYLLVCLASPSHSKWYPNLTLLLPDPCYGTHCEPHNHFCSSPEWSLTFSAHGQKNNSHSYREAIHYVLQMWRLALPWREVEDQQGMFAVVVIWLTVGYIAGIWQQQWQINVRVWRNGFMRRESSTIHYLSRKQTFNSIVYQPV